MPNTVTVPEVKPVTVTPRHALRLFVGRFIVDYVETFVGLIPVQVFAAIVVPTTVADARSLALQLWVQLAGPALSALVSALRRAWPTIKAWLAPEA